MRMLGAVFVVLLTALPAAAQSDNISQLGVTAKPAAQVTKFRKSGARAATLRARAAARRSGRYRAFDRRRIGQQTDPFGGSDLYPREVKATAPEH